ncbi:ABC transporter ATP-binding protein [Caldanaerobius polysaccharolyticus]|uniref:ABC transporter ATP-binding protein n=1 Tax=Caldanaerobius polysaccharolyticus TaxID=44256 RepID=UPI00047EF4B2|nr:ATP-binding cassette domain-containing protein [Caldanaerobius polysaccharolyticus]
MISIQNLTKRFGNTIAVNAISFEIHDGEIFGLLGENGAGKTTTMRMLATMLKPTSGTAKINGYDIVSQPFEVRKRIGILFGGEAGLYDRLTARENIAYFAELNGMQPDKIHKRIDELAEILDMKDFLDKRVGKFSKGMKQKVTIARSIVHNPDVMLLDEPSIGLDVTSTRMLHDFIYSCKQQGKSVVYSSHIMSEIEKLCDRLAIIHKGALMTVCTIHELKNKYQSDNLEEIFIKVVGGNNE